ncbi:MAG TPA: hypothetical protein VIO60_11580 [Rectinemataceae bacterium]
MTNPFQLGQPGGALASFSAPAKLICLLLAVLAIMKASPMALILFLVAGAALQYRKGARASSAVSGLGPVLILCLFSIGAAGALPKDGRLFAAESLALSLPHSARLVSAFLFAKAFYASTRLAELGESLSVATRGAVRAAAWLKPRIEPGKANSPSFLSDPGLFFSLGLLFLPRSFDTYIRVSEAAEVRGLSRRFARNDVRPFSTGFSKPFSGRLAVLETALYASVRKALRTAQAMEIRAYSPARTLRPPSWKLRDSILVSVFVSILALILALG